VRVGAGTSSGGGGGVWVGRRRAGGAGRGVLECPGSVCRCRCRDCSQLRPPPDQQGEHSRELGGAACAVAWVV
jgi:hypothetical protein